MTLSHGPTTLAIPGPSLMPERVLRAMHRAAPNIYTGHLVDMTRSLIPDLKAVARTSHNAVIYIGNGHAAWEAVLANTHSRGDRVLVPHNGHFADTWAKIAAGLGLRPEILRGDDPRRPVDPAAIGERLRADADHEIASVLAVHVDTATGLRADIGAIRDEMDAADHPALLHADCMASLGCDRFEMDDWGVNVMMSGSQKGLMTPPGMAFVFYDELADAAREGAGCVTAYWDWRPRTDPAYFYQHFAGTAPTHHLYGLREALDMLVHEEGIEAAWTRHRRLATALWDAFDVWEAPGGMELNVRDRAHRSHAVTAIRLPERGTDLRDWCERQMGVTLGIGLGMAGLDDPAWHGFFRVGHMGHLSGHSMLGTLGAIEAALAALDVPHGRGGVTAAARSMAATAPGA